MAQNVQHIRVNGSDYGGQDPSKGITYTLTEPVEVGDTVAPNPAVPGAVMRCPDGGVPIGVLTTKEKDLRGAVWSFQDVTPVRLTGALTVGLARMTGDGNGGVKLAAATANTGLGVVVIGAQVVDTVNQVAVYRH